MPRFARSSAELSARREVRWRVCRNSSRFRNSPSAPFPTFSGASDMLVMSHLHDVQAAENRL